MFLYPHVTSYNRAGAVLGMYVLSAGTVPDCVGEAVRRVPLCGWTSHWRKSSSDSLQKWKVTVTDGQTDKCLRRAVHCRHSLLAVQNHFKLRKAHFESLFACLFVCLFVCLLVCLFACLFVCLFFVFLLACLFLPSVLFMHSSSCPVVTQNAVVTKRERNFILFAIYS